MPFEEAGVLCIVNWAIEEVSAGCQPRTARPPQLSWCLGAVHSSTMSVYSCSRGKNRGGASRQQKETSLMGVKRTVHFASSSEERWCTFPFCSSAFPAKTVPSATAIIPLLIWNKQCGHTQRLKTPPFSVTRITGSLLLFLFILMLYLVVVCYWLWGTGFQNEIITTLF